MTAAVSPAQITQYFPPKKLFPPLFQNEAVERFHSREQQPCKFIETKEGVYIRKEFNFGGSTSSVVVEELC